MLPGHFQVNAELPFELDIVFESGSKDETDEELAGEAYGKALASRIKGFQVGALSRNGDYESVSIFARFEDTKLYLNQENRS